MIESRVARPIPSQYESFLMSLWKKISYLVNVNPATALQGLGGGLTDAEIASGEQLLQAIAGDELQHMIVVCRFGSILRATLFPDPMCVRIKDHYGQHIKRVMSIIDRVQDPGEFPGLFDQVSQIIEYWTTQPSALYSPVGFKLGIAFDYVDRPGLVVGPLMPGAFERLMEGTIVSNFH